MSRQLINIAVCIFIVIGTPIYLAGMLLLFCVAVTVHAFRHVVRRLLGRCRIARLIRFHRLGQ